MRDHQRGAARADPVGADRAGIPSSQPGHLLLLLLFTNRLRAGALDVVRHIARHVEHQHVVALCNVQVYISTYFNDDNTLIQYCYTLYSLQSTLHWTADYT